VGGRSKKPWPPKGEKEKELGEETWGEIMWESFKRHREKSFVTNDGRGEKKRGMEWGKQGGGWTPENEGKK